MDTYNNSKRIKIVFFSGTGGTAKVANLFRKSLERKGKTIIMHELHTRNLLTMDQEEMLILIFPVYACNAPQPVYEYIHNTATVEKIPAVVISVSGGGEITPNTASRVQCIKGLEKKGFHVIYEKMLIMPSNFIIPTMDGLAIRLLEILPSKIEHISNDLLSGVNHRTRPDFLNRVFSYIGELEKYGARFFGKRIKVNENCNGCGWCEKVCSRANITLVNGIPNFKGDCLLCLKCIYGCPQKALIPGIGKFIVIKQGYNLNDIEKRMVGNAPASVEELAKGYAWKGVKEYLLEDK